MSSFLETLAGYQIGNLPALAAIIGERLYPVEAPQDVAVPFGVFTQISAAEHVTHGGKSGWGSMRVNYEFYAATFHEVVDAARALRAEFEGRSVTLATGTQSCWCAVESEYDDYDSGKRIYRRSIDLLFEYSI